MTSEYAEQIIVDAVVNLFQPVDIDATKASLPMNFISRKKEKLKYNLLNVEKEGKRARNGN